MDHNTLHSARMSRKRKYLVGLVAGGVTVLIIVSIILIVVFSGADEETTEVTPETTNEHTPDVSLEKLLTPPIVLDPGKTHHSHSDESGPANGKKPVLEPKTVIANLKRKEAPELTDPLKNQPVQAVPPVQQPTDLGAKSPTATDRLIDPLTNEPFVLDESPKKETHDFVELGTNHTDELGLPETLDLTYPDHLEDQEPPTPDQGESLEKGLESGNYNDGGRVIIESPIFTGRTSDRMEEYKKALLAEGKIVLLSNGRFERVMKEDDKKYVTDLQLSFNHPDAEQDKLEEKKLPYGSIYDLSYDNVKLNKTYGDGYKRMDKVEFTPVEVHYPPQDRNSVAIRKYSDLTAYVSPSKNDKVMSKFAFFTKTLFEKVEEGVAYAGVFIEDLHNFKILTALNADKDLKRNALQFVIRNNDPETPKVSYDKMAHFLAVFRIFTAK